MTVLPLTTLFLQCRVDSLAAFITQQVAIAGILRMFGLVLLHH